MTDFTGMMLRTNYANKTEYYRVASKNPPCSTPPNNWKDGKWNVIKCSKTGKQYSRTIYMLDVDLQLLVDNPGKQKIGNLYPTKFEMMSPPGSVPDSHANTNGRRRGLIKRRLNWLGKKREAMTEKIVSFDKEATELLIELETLEAKG